MSLAEPLAAARPIEAHAFARDADDWYVEPEDCTLALARVEPFVGRIRDPACGGGNVVKALTAFGYGQVSGSDLVDRVHDLPTWSFFGTSDFLTAEIYPVDNLVFNPPFGRKGDLAEAFCRRALQAARRKVCAFLPLDFLAADDRWPRFLNEHPFSRFWVLTPRPSCLPGNLLLRGVKAEGGRKNFGWMVWDKADPNPSRILGQASRRAP